MIEPFSTIVYYVIPGSRADDILGRQSDKVPLLLGLVFLTGTKLSPPLSVSCPP